MDKTHKHHCFHSFHFVSFSKLIRSMVKLSILFLIFLNFVGINSKEMFTGCQKFKQTNHGGVDRIICNSISMSEALGSITDLIPNLRIFIAERIKIIEIHGTIKTFSLLERKSPSNNIFEIVEGKISGH